MESTTSEKLDLRSLDIRKDNKEKLKQFFPSVFTETVNKNGKLVESIDFEKLKAELGIFSDVFESRRERYGMDWPGKKDCISLIQQRSTGTLKPCPEESVDFDTTENLFIEGDNLEVLKLLQKSYYNKVKMIYIDPPYNTGKEFIYPDNYSETLDTYLSYAGLVDDDGKKFSTNTATEGRFHTKWMNMMYPRLYLAKNLLKEDGVIFISIDDNEVDNLKKICNEIFGEENFIAQFIRKTKVGSGHDSGKIAIEFDYILCYCKNYDLTELNREKIDVENDAKYRFSDEYVSTRGKYYLRDLDYKGNYSESMDYPIETPAKTVIYAGGDFGKPNTWRWAKEKFEWGKLNGYIEFKKLNDNWKVYIKQYQYVDNNNQPYDREIPYRASIEYLNALGSSDISKLFENDIFSYPKPVDMIINLLNIASLKDSIILDFFAGSATTAQAVFNQNLKDMGHRKFILVQLPEPVEEKHDISDISTIADIGKERARRASNQIKNDSESHLHLDLGFKVFKLNKSNFKSWAALNSNESNSKIIENLEHFINNIDEKSTPEDLLYEILLKSGFALTEKIEIKKMGGQKVYSVSGGALLICLEDEISREMIDEVAASEPSKFICLDIAFKGNDQLKANAVQTFDARNKGKDKVSQIEFRTI